VEAPTDITGWRVLLICPPFFGYDDAIASELERRGASVDRLQDRPFHSATAKALTKLAPRLAARAATIKYRRDLSHAKTYDMVLVVNGQTLTPDFLSDLRIRNPAATIRLYLWDSLSNRKSILGCLPMYDKVMTFDPEDAARFGIQHRPLFFTPEFEQESPEGTPQSFDYDISFIGTAHTDRWWMVTQVDRILPQGVRRFWFLYLQARWVFYIRRLFDQRLRGARVEQFSFAPLSRSRVSELFRASRIILDIEHPSQRGLTIRTIEAIGAQKKLITTNQDTKNYEFFDERNVVILRRGSIPTVSEEFLAAPYFAIPADTYEYYSIRGWTEDVLG
jgi:hypothetical protein